MNSSRSIELSRRDLLRRAAGGFGALALAGLFDEIRRSEAATDPLAPRPPHFPARARRVIFLFMPGGTSHVDSFDPKPSLVSGHMKKTGDRFLLRPAWEFKPRGRCGIEVSDLFPHVAECADLLTVVRSMRTDHGNHFEATLAMHTGSETFARPSLGSWVSYGLGTPNRNLPSFVVLAPHLPYAGGQVWASDFLPGCHQGCRFAPGPRPVPDVERASPSELAQRLEIEALARRNARHEAPRAFDERLEARIRSFETAFAMQAAAPEAFDLAGESDETLALYGLERGKTSGFAWQCLVARRLAERGVRFIELIDVGAGGNWDAHGDMATHGPLAKNIDQPIAGLLRDLERRGMLDDTLVVWTTEFGRTPTTKDENGKGRDHHNAAFSSWLAGGGVKRGHVHGATDETGTHVAAGAVHVHDLHATILHLLGLDHTRLTYRHAGRDFRLTDVHGEVVRGLLA